MVVWPDMVKVTFTFDDETVNALRRTASRLKKPQSAVVREAIQEYANRAGRLSEEERRHLLKVFDRMVARIPAGSQAEADAEIAQIRSARKTGGRRTRP
jgi:predicted transcriptional regulator